MEEGETPEAPQATAPAQTEPEFKNPQEEQSANKALDVARKMTEGVSPEPRTSEEVVRDWVFQELPKVLDAEQRYFFLLEQKAVLKPNTLSEFEKKALKRNREAQQATAHLRVHYVDFPKDISRLILNQLTDLQARQGKRE